MSEATPTVYDVSLDVMRPVTQKDVDIAQFVELELFHWSRKTPAMPLQTFVRQLSGRIRERFFTEATP